MSLRGKDEILKQLMMSGGTPVSGQDMADRMGVSRTAVWKYIKELESDGYQIGSVRKKGYYLLDTPDVVNAAAIQRHLKTNNYGRHIQYYESCPTTQSIAHEEAQNGASDGTLIIAEEQTAGKGRMSRPWSSSARKGIWMSLIIRPSLMPQQAPQMTLVAAVAIVRAMEEVAEVQPTIKWPNDILINGKKMTGILTELQADMDRVKAIILGMGINANQEETDFPDELREIATSLHLVTGEKVDRSRLVAAILYYLELYTKMYEKNGFAPIKLLWESYSNTVGKRVRAVMLNETIEGTAIGISDEGLLELRLDDGSIRGIYSADIQMAK